MKVLFLALCLVAGAFARSAVQNNVNAEGPRCPIDDPLTAAGPLPINATLEGIVDIAEGSIVSNLIVEGGSTLYYKIELNALLLTATFELTVAKASGNATYSASGNIDASPISDAIIPSGDFTGNGLGKVAIENLRVKGRVQLFINIIGNKVNIRTLTIEEGVFDSLSVDFGAEWRIAGKPVDWVAFNAGIKAGWDSEFAAKHAEVTEKFRIAANGIIGEYTLEELIEIISGGGNEPCPEP